MAEYYIKWHTSPISRPNISELKLKSIPIKSILYFEEVGEMHQYKFVYREKTTTKTYFWGEAIFDAAGEVISAREPIKT